jgi:hypothetical protein
MNSIENQPRTSHRIRSARVNRRPPSFVVTLTALAIVCALAWMFFVRAGSSAPAPAVQSIHGTYTWGPADGPPSQTGTFSAVADGGAGGDMTPSEHILGLSASQSGYDAGTRTETTLGGKGRPILTRTVGQWPPVWRVATKSPLDYQGLAAVVRTAVEDGDDTVGIKPLKQAGRTVWRAAMTMGGKEINVVVDQETGIVTWYSDAESAFTATVDWASPPAAGTTYRVDAPAGTPAKTVKDGAMVYADSPAEAGADAGYAPLVSDLAPDGYTRTAVATRPAESLPADWAGIDVGSPPIPPAGRAVLQAYTRGLSQFTLEQVGPRTLRGWESLAGEAAEAARDRLSFQETTLQFGAFKGRTALTWYQVSGPSLFVAGARRAVFVTGALTRQELIAFAEGLQPVPADAAK